VVINDSANATLAVGASPIMATNPSDCKDLSPVIGALLVNFGQVHPEITRTESSTDTQDNHR
jgi:thiamine-phosphate diphosphorylase/hydroxyethylthiazole kinase